MAIVFALAIVVRGVHFLAIAIRPCFRSSFAGPAANTTVGRIRIAGGEWIGHEVSLSNAPLPVSAGGYLQHRRAQCVGRAVVAGHRRSGVVRIFIARAGTRFFNERVGLFARSSARTLSARDFFRWHLAESVARFAADDGILWCIGAAQQQPRPRLCWRDCCWGP